MPSAGKSAVNEAFSILREVHQDSTMWSVVYEMSGGKIHFRTNSCHSVRVVDMAGFDYSCKSPVRVLDIMVPGRGQVNAGFRDYSVEANRRLIDKVFGEIPFLREYRGLASMVLAAYPETTVCAAQ